jgi:nucleotide-binding universal stress UspA family protein
MQSSSGKGARSMTIRKILVPFHVPDAAETSLKAAIAIATRCKAQIDVLHIRQRPNIPASGYYPVGVVMLDEHLSELQAALDADAKRLKEVFDRVAGAGVATREDAAPAAFWRDRQGVLPFDISAAARVADLIVFGRAGDDIAFPDANIIEEAIFQSARPVLIAPTGKLDRAPARVLVAWNGGREAARALIAALALLKEADAVKVVSIGALAGDLEGPESAAALLRLHGVKANAERRTPVGPAEDDLLEAAREMNAELIVMGAYSHSRWRELVLGGFTRKLLKQTEFALLLAH